MTVASLITTGIGPGSTILYVLTGGLDTGATPPPPPPPPTDAFAGGALYWAKRRRKRKLPRTPDERAELRAILQAAYDDAIGRPRAPAAEAITATVGRFVRTNDGAGAVARPAIDWDALLASASAIETILRAYLKQRADEEEEEAILLLMH